MAVVHSESRESHDFRTWCITLTTTLSGHHRKYRFFTQVGKYYKTINLWLAFRRHDNYIGLSARYKTSMVLILFPMTKLIQSLNQRHKYPSRCNSSGDNLSRCETSSKTTSTARCIRDGQVMQRWVKIHHDCANSPGSQHKRINPKLSKSAYHNVSKIWI